MPRLVRQRPLLERITASLDPYDLLLWLAEELHESSWDESLKEWTLPIGVAANILFLVARSYGGSANTSANNDVFGDDDSNGSFGWFKWLCAIISYFLALFALMNASYAFLRKRHYRLFESSIDETPSTPSARRVNVNSSPASGSPFRFLSSLVTSPSANSRAHPDQTRDVWEVSVWDPLDVNLELFTLFSPGHILIYWLFLPTLSSDPRPSVTIASSIFMSALLSVQLVWLRKSFTLQSKDLRIINKEVMNEYDTKFVHPTINRPVRDVGTQTRETAVSAGVQTREVDVYTPTTIINRGFKVNPNPSYAPHLSEDSFGDANSPSTGRLPRSITTPNLYTPSGAAGIYKPLNSPFRGTPNTTTPSRPSMVNRSTNAAKSDGGSLGVYSHAASPLRKAVSSSQLRAGARPESMGTPGKSGSPLKRMSTPGGVASGTDSRLSDSSRHRVHNFK